MDSTIDLTADDVGQGLTGTERKKRRRSNEVEPMEPEAMVRASSRVAELKVAAQVNEWKHKCEQARPGSSTCLWF